MITAGKALTALTDFVVNLAYDFSLPEYRSTINQTEEVLGSEEREYCEFYLAVRRLEVVGVLWRQYRGKFIFYLTVESVHLVRQDNNLDIFSTTGEYCEKYGLVALGTGI